MRWRWRRGSVKDWAVWTLGGAIVGDGYGSAFTITGAIGGALFAGVASYLFLPWLTTFLGACRSLGERLRKR